MQETQPKQQKREHKPLVNDQVRQMRSLGYITAREAAKIGQVSIPRIYALVDAKKIAGARRGSRRYILKSSVESYFSLKVEGAQ